MATNIKNIFEVAEERGREEGREEGREDGREEGEIKKARIAILNMLKMDMFPLEQIADILDVELDFVLNVREEWILNPLLSA